MAKPSKMPFSIEHHESNKQTCLGYVEAALWSIRMLYDDEQFYVEIYRSISNGKVQVNVQVNQNGWNLLSKCRHILLDGQHATRLRSGFPAEGGTFTGFLTVYNNLNCKLTTKNGAATQPENDTSWITEKLMNDFLHLLDNPDSFSDATLVCGTTKLAVHRNILSARSPVFAAMFQTQMQEGREGVVDIVDMEPDVLKAMLRYVYSGRTDHLTQSMAGDLLFAADKYQLQELKLICVEQLKPSMAANNIFRYLVLGDLHDESLKVYAVEFICKCKDFSELEKTEEWQSLMKERPSLALEVMTALVKYLQKK